MPSSGVLSLWREDAALSWHSHVFTTQDPRSVPRVQSFYWGYIPETWFFILNRVMEASLQLPYPLWRSG